METWVFVLINAIVDCCFLADIIVTFRTTFVD
jgi:hypothetical protein